MREEAAALVVSSASDITNTNVAFTVRGLCDGLRIITSASDETSIDILKRAGSNIALRPDTMISDNTVLVLAGSRDHMSRYDERFCTYNVSNVPVVILGGGRAT